MRPALFTINRPGTGRLSIMAKPRSGDWLNNEMAGLRDHGVDILVSALTTSEVRDVDLTDEPQAAVNAGLAFVSIPIPDRGVPDLSRVLPHLQRLALQLRDGAHIVIHCRFGIGRASLLAAGILVLDGLALDQAWRQLEQARGLAVPDTAQQREWATELLKQVQA